MYENTAEGKTESFYTQVRAEHTDVNPPLVRAWNDEFLQHVVGTQRRINPPNQTTAMQRVCANNSHLGLTPDMTRGQFNARMNEAHEVSFQRTIEMGTRPRKCTRCGNAYTIKESLGRHACRYHPGFHISPRRWLCCNDNVPCTPCDHYDGADPERTDGSSVRFTLIHVATLQFFMVPPSSRVWGGIDVSQLDPGRAMDLNEAQVVGGKSCMVYVRIK